MVKTTSAAVCAAMLANTGFTVLAADKMAVKDENVYVDLNQDGSVAGIYVVNEYNRENAGSITDYGDYTSVKNLTTDEKIRMLGNKITVEAPKGKFYYQGNLAGDDMPWLIQITYLLDGKEISAEDLAGKNGSLELRIQIRENQNCSGVFFDNYLLQATVVLDTEKCTQIEAEGAAAGNVGKNRQLIYNIMAGSEKDISIKAQVADFEMDGINFQGIPMSFDIDKDSIDQSSLAGKTKEITDAALKLDDGAGELLNGTKEAADGAKNLDDGVKQFAGGISELREGSSSLAAGGSSMVSGTKKLQSVLEEYLAGVDTASSGSEELRTGIGTFSFGIKQIQTGAAGLKNGTDAYTQGADQLAAGITGYVEGTQALAEGAADLKSLEDLGQVNSAIVQMQQAVTAGSGDIPGLENGAKNLADGLEAIKKQVDSLADTADVQSLKDVLEGLDGLKKELENLADLAEEISGGLSQSAGAAGQISDDHKAVMEGLQNQTDQANAAITQSGENLAGQVNTQVDGVNAQIAAAADNVNGQIESAIGTIQNGIDSKNIEESAGRALIDSLEASKIEAVSVEKVEAPAAGISEIQMPEENRAVETAAEQLLSTAETLSKAADAFDEAAKQMKAVSGQIPETGGVHALEGLSAALGEACEGAARLQEGIRQTGDGLTQLEKSTARFPEAAEGVTALLDGFSKLGENDQTLLAGAQEISGNGESLRNGAGGLERGTGQLAASAKTLRAGAVNLEDGMLTLKENGTGLRLGMQTIAGGTYDLQSGIGSLSNGISLLDGQTGTLKTGTGTLAGGLEKLKEGTDTLKEGTTEFKGQTSHIDDEVEQEIDKILKAVSGEDFTPASFTSPENTETGLVQFAIKTDGIKKAEAEETEAEPKKESFWDKVKGLFH